MLGTCSRYLVAAIAALLVVLSGRRMGDSAIVIGNIDAFLQGRPRHGGAESSPIRGPRWCGPASTPPQRWRAVPPRGGTAPQRPRADVAASCVHL